MAKFITNSVGTKAIKKDSVLTLEITYNTGRLIEGSEPIPAFYSLDILSAAMLGHVWSFETDPTLEGIQAKAATVLAALES